MKDEFSNERLNKIISNDDDYDRDHHHLAEEILETRKLLNETIDRQMENERLQAELDNTKAALSALQEATRWNKTSENHPDEGIVVNIGGNAGYWIEEESCLGNIFQWYEAGPDGEFMMIDGMPELWQPLSTPPEAGTK